MDGWMVGWIGYLNNLRLPYEMFTPFNVFFFLFNWGSFFFYFIGEICLPCEIPQGYFSGAKPARYACATYQSRRNGVVH
jgi:hypothetical protein